jgi:phosphoserine aminotransferase
MAALPPELARPAASAAAGLSIDPRRIHNFSSGPCTLPLPVLERARDEFVEYGGEGMSLIEMSHRSAPVQTIRDEAVSLLRELLGVPASHHIAFIGGGATLQFGMVPMNLLYGDRVAAYTDAGTWGTKAVKDAEAVVADQGSGSVEVVFDGKADRYTTLPDVETLTCPDHATYLHLTSNETIGGLQWKQFPTVKPPMVADMSSDFLSRPIDFDRFGLIYAGAQKNIGPAGVCVVIIRDDVMKDCRNDLVGYLNYPGHVKGESMLNTPPVFQVYMVKLVLEWLKEAGGLTWAADMAERRSGMLYGAIDGSGGFYTCPVDARYRSRMNVVFRLPEEPLEKRFGAEAEAAGLSGLEGHRSVGGCRASIYNAMPIAGVEALTSFMREFVSRHG